MSTLLVGSCGSPTERGAEVEGELGETKQMIENGTNNASVTSHGHTVRVLADLNCTGTLLRNNIVITSRHCVGSVSPENYLVRSGWDGSSWAQTASVLSVDRFFKSDCSWCLEGWANDETDVAILRLAVPLPIDSKTVGAFRSLYPFNDDNLDGKTVTCEGTGNSVCTNGNPSNSGALLSMVTTVSNVIISETTGRYKIAANSSNQRHLSGDSGGSCWLDADSFSNYRYVFGVNKVTGCGQSSSSQILNQVMRPWVRAKLGAYASDFFTTFGSASELSDWTIMEPPESSGGPPDWEISNGALREHSDMKGIPSTIPGTTIVSSVEGTGTHIIHDAQVIANAQVDTKIYSADDDSAGIIFRYVNERNYYRLVANEYNGGTLKFERVRDGNVTAYGNKTNLGFDWSDGVKLTVISRNHRHWAYIDNEYVTYMFDKAHPDGRVGLHNRLLKDAAYVYFAVYHDDDVHPEAF